MNKIPNLVIRLGLIALVAGLVLAAVNGVTSPIIEEQNAAKLAESLIVVYPEGNNFTPVEDAELAIGDNTAVKEIYNVDEQGNVFRVVAPGGYGGDIEFIVGISNEGIVQGFSVLNHSETPGFGDEAATLEYGEGLKGLNAQGQLVPAGSPSEENEFQAMSGATISTNAISNGLNQAAEVNRNLQ